MFLVCLAVGFVLSWTAVYSFSFAANLFHSVAAVRAADGIANIILLPVRTLFHLAGDVFDQSAPLSDPMTYACVNAVLLAGIGYVICRRWIFPDHTDSDKPR